MANLRIERDGDVLRVTLARPDRRNAFDAELIAELASVFVDVGRARAVVLAGEGRSFCAGADVEWMRSSVDLTYDENIADALGLRRMLEAVDGCPAPVICRVQGHALGGGAGLVACADIVLAAPDAVFAFSEAKTVSGAAITTSAHATRPAPPPRAWPCTRQITGTGQPSIASSIRRRPSASAMFSS